MLSWRSAFMQGVLQLVGCWFQRISHCLSFLFTLALSLKARTQAAAACSHASQGGGAPSVLLENRTQGVKRRRHLQNGPQVAEQHAAAADVQQAGRRRNVHDLQSPCTVRQ